MNLEKAPEKGIIYALYTDRVVFDRYEKENLPNDAVLQNNLLELHLFDQNREYRFVRSRRGNIEAEIFDELSSSCEQYIESVFTDHEKIPTVEVVNYISYDENDLMMINNYRLREVGV